MSEPQPEQIYEAEIKCPNCKMIRQHTYTKQSYSPVYGECTFCKTLWRWTKTKTIEVIPADRKQYMNVSLAIEANNSDTLYKKESISLST